MKKARKLITFILTVVMVLSMSMNVWADGDTPYTITIDNENAGYTYQAYQVFSGDVYNGKLTDITWGNGVNGDALLAALTTETIDENPNPDYIEAFKDCGSAADIAKALSGEDDDGELAKAFADVVSKYLTNVAKTSTENAGPYTINVEGDGYYFVQNSAIPENADDKSGTYTRYLLEVVGENVNVEHKGTVPEATKTIVGGASETIDDAAIGDTVTYMITGTVTDDIDNYNEYYYVFTDTLSKGLTYGDIVSIMVEGEDVKQYFYKNTETDANNNTILTIGMQDLLTLENLDDPVIEIDKDTVIEIRYTATVNADAVVEEAGNSNKVYLQYSNNPNESGEGTEADPNPNTEPDPNTTPIGKTPEQEVITYVTELTIQKTDGDNALTGAAFRIEGKDPTVTNIVKTTGEVYVKDGEGTYYKLNDGTYTTEAPDGNEGDYDDPSQKYSKKVDQSVSINTTEGDVKAEGFVNSAGKLTFTGLSAGTYTITEIVTPEGYNSIQPFDVVIEFNEATGEFTIDDADIQPIEVINNAGSELPSTGGIGTTIFYIVGGALVLFAVVLLVTKKRMKDAQ